MNKAMTDVLKDKRKTFLFVFLAIALVLATWYKLKIQGITMTEDVSYEEVLICENTDETHVHSAECYEKVAVTSSDKQKEINQSEEQIQDTTDTNLEESEEQKENEQDENVNQQLEQNNETDSQENIPEYTGQKEIAEDMGSNDVMTANAFALDGGISTYALGDTSDDRSKVNVYINIDDTWQSIGYVDRGSYKSGRTTYYSVSSEAILTLMHDVLNIRDVSTNEFTIYYASNNSDTYTKRTLSNGIYSLGKTDTHRNVYITASLTSNTISQLTSNTFKVYSITEYTAENEQVSKDYVYTTTGTATYQLPSEYNYYVKTSPEAEEILVIGGSTINITGSTTLKQTPAEKCTVTIIHVDGTISTQEVNKGSTYTLGSNLKWKVGDSTELTDGGTQITVNEDITVTESNQITINYTVDTSTNATGIDAKYLYDGIAIPTVQGSNTYTTTITYSDGTIIEDLSDKYVTPYNSTATVSKDRIVLEFTGWKVNNSSTIINAQTELTWSELYNYAQNGVINLNTIWSRITNNRNYVNFYIRYDSVAVDTDGNITSQATDKYTPSLWASYVGNSSLAVNIADTTSDNSYTANKNIRALEGVKENAAYIYSEPTDEYVLSQLKIYADYLSIDGEKVSIALYRGTEQAIISQAYSVFEIIDAKQLLPEYLMMWFRRPEFDRYARFKSHGSAREIFDWSEMCDVLLPIPPIARQHEIVAEYAMLVNRIRLNNRMISTLESTAQTLYRKMFVDNIDKNNLPTGWRMGTIGEYATVKSGFAFNSTWWQKSGIPVIKIGNISNLTIDDTECDYVDEQKMAIAENYIAKEGDIIIAMTGATLGKIAIISKGCFLVNQRVGLFDLGDSPINTAAFLYVLLQQDFVQNDIFTVGGDSAQANVSNNDIEKISIPFYGHKNEVYNVSMVL